MLGKLIAESGAAKQISDAMMNVFGEKYIQWGMMVTGFIIGIPLFYGVGFVLMIPLIFSVSYQYKLPAVYVGLPMLAALSVTHGFLPPHPSPSALVIQFKANMGLTLLYGIIVAIPAIIIAGPIFSRTFKNLVSGSLKTFIPVQLIQEKIPGTAISFFTALLPVLLLMITTLYPFIFNHTLPYQNVVSMLGQPSIVMLIALLFASFSLGINCGRNIVQVMNIYSDAVKDVVMIVLIISGSGALKQILTDSGASVEIGGMLQNLSLPPLALAWFTAIYYQGMCWLCLL